MSQNTIWKQDVGGTINVLANILKHFASVIIRHLKMAYRMTREEVLAQVLRENDEEYSDFDDSESDEGEEDDNNVYGYPNDRSGRVFGKLSSDVEIDANLTNVNKSRDLNDRERMQNDEAPTIVFIDEQDVDVRVAIVEDEVDH